MEGGQLVKGPAGEIGVLNAKHTCFGCLKVSGVNGCALSCLKDTITYGNYSGYNRVSGFVRSSGIAMSTKCYQQTEKDFVLPDRLITTSAVEFTKRKKRAHDKETNSMAVETFQE